MPPKYLIRDNDRIFGTIFRRRVRAMGIRDRPTAPRSPRQNGYAERLIGSIRRECLDYVVVFSERHLRHLLRAYMEYYNDAHAHISLRKDSPIYRAIEAIGGILAIPILGGLHHRYARIQFMIGTAVRLLEKSLEIRAINRVDGMVVLSLRANIAEQLR